MKFGQQLKTARINQKLSAGVLAKACGVSRSYITLIENGKRRPSVKVLPKIATALGLKTDLVLNWYLEDVKYNAEKRLTVE